MLQRWAVLWVSWLYAGYGAFFEQAFWKHPVIWTAKQCASRVNELPQRRCNEEITCNKGWGWNTKTNSDDTEQERKIRLTSFSEPSLPESHRIHCSCDPQHVILQNAPSAVEPTPTISLFMMSFYLFFELPVVASNSTTSFPWWSSGFFLVCPYYLIIICCSLTFNLIGAVFFTVLASSSALYLPGPHAWSPEHADLTIKV